MRTAEDAIRSVRRYVAAALGSPPWRVMLAAEEGRFRRPYAVVTNPTGRRTERGGAADTELKSMPVVIHLFPPAVDDAGDPFRASEAKLVAERAAHMVEHAISVGIEDPDPSTSVRGFRLLIPLWDYRDATGAWLPLEGPGSTATLRTPRDYLRVEDAWTVEVQPEQSEDQLYVVVVNLRVQWYRGTRLPVTGKLLAAGHVHTTP